MVVVALQCVQAVYELDDSPVSDAPDLPTLLASINLNSSNPTEKRIVSDADKKEAERLKNAGNDHLTAGRAGLAVECYSKAIALDPTNVVFYSNRYIIIS